jgi:hypothetical protein
MIALIVLDQIDHIETMVVIDPIILIVNNEMLILDTLILEIGLWTVIRVEAIAWRSPLD